MSRIVVQGREPSEIKSAEEARKIKQAEEKKKPENPKVKQYFDIKVDALVPCSLTYRIYAYDEKEALDQIAKAVPTNVKPNLSLKKLVKAAVYKAGSSMLIFTKWFRI